MTIRLNKIIFFLCFLQGAAHVSLGQPQMVFEATRHDFGTVVEGESPSHVFRFTNEGDQPLVIAKVKSSCGCTTPMWPKEPLPPGATGIIKTTFNSNNRPGSFNKGVTITSNAVPSQALLTITGEVVAKNRPSADAIAKSPKIVVVSEEVRLKAVERNRPTSVMITLKNVGPTDLLIKNLSSTCDCVALGKGNDYHVPPGHSKNFRLVYRAKSLGDAREKITLVTNDLTQPTVTVTLRATVVETL